MVSVNGSSGAAASSGVGNQSSAQNVEQLQPLLPRYNQVFARVYDAANQSAVWDLPSLHAHMSQSMHHPTTGYAIRKVEYYALDDITLATTLVSTARSIQPNGEQAATTAPLSAFGQFEAELLNDSELSQAVVNVSTHNAVNEDTLWKLVTKMNALSVNNRMALLVFLSACFPKHSAIQSLAALFYCRTASPETDLKKACECITSAYQKDPNDPFTLTVVGYIYGVYGLVAEAFNFFSRALKNKPDCHFARFCAGRLLVLQNNTVNAERHLKVALQLRKDYAPTYRILIDLYIKKCDFTTAEKYIKEALAQWPDDTILPQLSAKVEKRQAIQKTISEEAIRAAESTKDAARLRVEAAKFAAIGDHERAHALNSKADDFVVGAYLI